MHPLNDHDLDRLSRKAADEFDVEMNASGWEALENRLNKELPLPAEKGKRRFLFWLFLIVLMAGSGLLWSMMHGVDKRLQLTGVEGSGTSTQAAANGPAVNDNQTTGKQEAADNAATDKEVGVLSGSGKTSSPVTKGNSAEKVTDLPGYTAKPGKQRDRLVLADKPLLKNKQAGNVHDLHKERSGKTGPLRKGNNNTGNDITGNNKRSAYSKSGSHKAGSNGTGMVNSKPGKGTKVSGAAGKEAGDNTQVVPDDHKAMADHAADADKPVVDHDGQQPLPDAVLDSLGRQIIAGSNKSTLQQPTDSILTQTPTAEAAITKKQPQQETKGKRGLEVGLVAGPDMSNVKFTHTDNSGYNVGVQIGYRFSERWSVNTGVMYTRKNYTVDGGDFAKTGYWTNPNVNLLTVDGYCKMFEVPLNIRYDLSYNERRRWFASAGVSTYFMTGESYNFDYLYGSMPRTYAGEYPEDSKYIFSILNLSAGYERRLGKRLGVQAEPYFKLPLKGLGHGNLDINSYGIYFSVKYRIGK